MHNLSRIVALTLVLTGCQRADHDDRIPPNAPTGLQAAALSNAEIQLNWEDESDNEDGFIVDLSSNGLDFTQIADVPADTPTAVISGLAPSVTYYFRVRAYGYRTSSAWSNTASATTMPLSWTSLTPTGTPPAPRFNHAVVYDGAGQRLVTFGGMGINRLNDTWALEQSTPLWREITPTTSPSARFDHAAAYDPVRRRMIVFGGWDHDFPNNNEVWALDLANESWSMLIDRNPSSPPSRTGHSLIYDGGNDRMILFGGNNGAGTGLNDVWALDLNTPSWTLITAVGPLPSPRYDHGAVYDGANRRMIILGGNDGSPYTNDTWALNLSGAPIWTRLAPAGTPPTGRAGHTMVYDATQKRIFVFGGDDGYSTKNDLWVLTLSGPLEWHPVFTQGLVPSPRMDHCAVYAPDQQALILFGGWDGLDSLNNEAWRLGL